MHPTIQLFHLTSDPTSDRERGSPTYGFTEFFAHTHMSDRAWGGEKITMREIGNKRVCPNICEKIKKECKLIFSEKFWVFSKFWNRKPG